MLTGHAPSVTSYAVEPHNERAEEGEDQSGDDDRYNVHAKQLATR
jgi:hypothetical protein